MDREKLNAAMVQLAQGERKAASAVFDALWPEVYAFCVRALRSTAHAEDVAQRSLVRLFEQASEFDPKRDALAWALEIAVWECRTQRRKDARPSATSGKHIGFEPASAEANSPETNSEQQALREALEKAIAALSDTDQETLRTLLADDVPTVTAATWRKRKERALARLRSMWRTLYGNS